MDAPDPGTADPGTTVAGATAAGSSGPGTIESRLDDLQRESEARRRELSELAALLPEVTSRRAVVTSMVASVVHAPDKPLVAKRVVLKALRTPRDVLRRIGNR